MMIKKVIKSLLVSQPVPVGGVESSPYFKLVERYGIKVDFRSFIEIKPIQLNEFRKQKIDLKNFTAVIFTSRNAVDHFFKICEELKVVMANDMKYFCVSESTANYLQRYIVVRKRKIFTGVRTSLDLIEVLKKHKKEKFIFPCSNIRKNDLPSFLQENEYDFVEAVIYETVASDLSDLSDVNYDCIAFFSPSGIKSLFTNFPDFEQKKTRIAAFGPTTANAVKESGLRIDVEAPLPNAPSMTGALELYIKKALV